MRHLVHIYPDNPKDFSI